MTTNKSIGEQIATGAEIARLFRMRRDPEHKDRWQTTWGNKTDLGIYNTVLRVAQMIQDGEEVKS